MMRKATIAGLMATAIMQASAADAPKVFQQGSFWLGAEQETSGTTQIQGKYYRSAAWIEGSNEINGKEYLMMWNGEIFYDDADKMFEGERKGTLYTMLREEDGKVFSASLGGVKDAEEVLIYDFNLVKDESATVYSPRQYANWHEYTLPASELEAACYRRATIASCGYEYPMIYLSGAYGESEGKEVAYWIGGIGSPDMPDGTWNMSFLATPYFERPWECVYADGKKVFDRSDAVVASSSYFREGTEWNVRVTYNTEGGETFGTEKFIIDGIRKFIDTPDKTYLTVMKEGLTNPAGFIRSEGEKVWYRGETGGEVLMYDFSVRPGERITVYDTMHRPLYMECVSLDTTESCGVEYSVIHFQQYDDEAYSNSLGKFGEVSWIVGIGSEAGVLHPGSPEVMLGGPGYELTSVESNGVTVFGNATLSVDGIAPDYAGDGIAYGIDGRRIEGNATGIFIRNGKKYIGR